MMSYTYEQLNKELNGKDRKVLKRNLLTWIERQEDHIGIFLVESEIMRYYPDGTIVLDSCGWQTVTTKQRMTNYLPRPWTIWKIKGVWYLADYITYRTGKEAMYPFSDGITITPEGTVKGSNFGMAYKNKNLLKALDKYVKGYVDALAKGKVPAPGPGDCFYCQMKVIDEGQVSNGQQVIEYGQGKLVDGQVVSEPISASKAGQTLGEATDSDHLLSHFEEPYYVPSLLYRAIELHGLHDTLSQMALWWIQEKWYGESNGSNHPLFARKDPYIEKQVRNCLKKYLKRQLGLPS